MNTERTLRAAAMAALSVLTPIAATMGVAQDATPAAVTCDDMDAPGTAEPPTAMAGMSDMAGMVKGTPMASMDHTAMELDQMYIDMMIPHHASIVAMAQAALPRLMDERLQAMAQAIIDAQSAEIEELRGYRGTFYGEAAPMPMNDAMVEAMDGLMPGMSGTLKEMDFQMDAAAQVAAICAAKDTDLAFIDLTIPHHQMAIESSETVAAEATHPEIRDFAQRVIDAQQQEIAELAEIRESLTGEATPAAS